MEKGLGLRIQEARKAAGYTQQQLCQVSGLSYSTLAKIERGAIKSPSVFTIQTVAGALGTSLDQLIGGSPISAQKPSKKRSKNGVEFVYFDINGSIVRFFHRAFGLIADEAGVPVDVIETTYWQYNDLVSRGDMSVGDFNRLLADRFILPGIDWTAFYLDAIEPISETIELIEWAQQHYRVGLLSNSMPGLISEMFKRNLLPAVDYDVIIDSSQTGLIKPEPAIYDLAAKESGSKPDSILLIDDSRPNLMAAGQLGWHVLWFDEYDPEASVERIKKALAF
ncbi:MAG TPA: HAD-IA family hydrolase [Patescibacteria group bacterium]|nr:HAD-IA family hydrolase [Patescibacteria group bacterium]